MGFGSKKPDADMQKLLDECERRLLDVIEPRYLYKAFDIDGRDDGIYVDGTSLILKGGDIAKHLSGCEKCVLMCVTLSSGADRLIRTLEACDMTEAVITDCLASAAVEQVCDIAENEIRSKLSDFNFTWRFSPGYGDLPLELQKDFLNVLDAPKRIGLNVTESMILIPRKSVTAVIGISHGEISKGRRGCISCNMKEICAYRKRGEHCGF